MPLTPGLVSVTFRSLSVAEVGTVAVAAGLTSVEWGADVHVPDQVSVEAALATGLEVAAYGSYWWAGDGEPFEPVVSVARALGAPTIRVWAGREGSPRGEVADALRAAADLAAEHGMTVSLEFHGGTLTETAGGTVALLEAVDHPAVRTYWQPPVGVDDDEALAGLRLVQPWLSNVHVFSWWPQHERLPLSGRAGLWKEALSLVDDSHALLEFVADDSPDQLMEDAEVLRGWL